jgi:HK97 family phage portal protein
MKLLDLFKRKSLVNTMDVGVLNQSWGQEWWQVDRKPISGANNPVVEACVRRYASSISSMPIEHYRTTEDGTRIHIRNSNALRTLRKPNPLMNQVEFLSNLVRSLFYTGNGFAVARRNSRTEIVEMWLLRPEMVHAYRLPEDGGVVYSISDSRFTYENFDPQYFVPARDMLHVKLATPHDPLRGVSPIESVVAPIQTNNAITQGSANFFTNQARPSGVISTDKDLTKDQITRLREVWNQQSKDMNSGKTPILASGLKWQQVSMSSQDAQTIEAYQMTVESITSVFGVPLALVNSMGNSTYNNTEQLISHWLSTDLGHTIKLIETSLENFFEMGADESLNLDEKILLRTNMKDRVDTLGQAVQRGIYSPNEARRIEGLPPVEGGEKPYLQQQMIQVGQTPEPKTTAQPNLPEPETQEDSQTEETEPQLTNEEAKSLIKSLLIGKMNHA